MWFGSSSPSMPEDSDTRDIGFLTVWRCKISYPDTCEPETCSQAAYVTCAIQVAISQVLHPMELNDFGLGSKPERNRG